jgi:hypothetical protein
MLRLIAYVFAVNKNQRVAFTVAPQHLLGSSVFEDNVHHIFYLATPATRERSV